MEVRLWSGIGGLYGLAKDEHMRLIVPILSI